MANEAELRLRLEHPIDMTVADDAGIEKGTICKLSDNLTAAASDGADDVVAGIAAREKVADDGRTRLAIFRRGIFDVYASGAITVGDPVSTSATANYVKAGVTANTSGAVVLGTALETASDGEVIQVELNPQVANIGAI